MCGRYTLARAWEELAGHFGIHLDDAPLLEPPYNVAPSQAISAAVVA